MPSRDISLELDPGASIKPQSLSAAAIGSGVNLQGCEAALIVVSNGAATTPATIQIQESADDSTYTVVADSDLIGLTGNASGVEQTASTIVKASYVGEQQYVRVNVLTGASAAFVSAEVVRGHLRYAGGEPV